jgi:hypothetical protein
LFWKKLDMCKKIKLTGHTKFKCKLLNSYLSPT